MKTVIKVNGMHCEGCENRIKNVLSTIDNIEDVIANHSNGQVEITSNEKIDLNTVKEKIENLGFEVEKENSNE